MQELIIDSKIKIVYELLEQPFSWEQSPFNGDVFVCLLVVNEKEINNHVQEQISSKLIDFGCKYAVCMGDNCSAWDTMIDLAYLEKHDYEVDDNDFVMTTWHDNESIEDIVFFFLNNTNFDWHTFENYLVLFLGKDDDKKSTIILEIEKMFI